MFIVSFYFPMIQTHIFILLNDSPLWALRVNWHTVETVPIAFPIYVISL